MVDRRVTIDTAKAMPFEQLVDYAHGLIEQYSVPPAGEASQQRMARIERAIDELPDIYNWLLQLESVFDHWTDALADVHGMKANEYKWMRERRDAMQRAAKACKIRYEGASRVLTRTIELENASRMPRGRG